MPNFGLNLLTVQYFRTIPEVSEEVNLSVYLKTLVPKLLYSGRFSTYRKGA
jgi:hypothetical protein